eukprot:sb/3470912/
MIPVWGPDAPEPPSSSTNVLIPSPPHLPCHVLIPSHPTVVEERPEVEVKCPEEVIHTDKGRFTWVTASTGVKVMSICPHGSALDSESNKGYATRSCLPTDDGIAIWSTPDISQCLYRNLLTQQLETLGQVEVTHTNAIEVAGQVLDLTEQSKKFDETGVTMVTGIMEKLVAAGNQNSTVQLAKTLSNLLEVFDT